MISTLLCCNIPYGRLNNSGPDSEDGLWVLQPLLVNTWIIRSIALFAIFNLACAQSPALNYFACIIKRFFISQGAKGE